MIDSDAHGVETLANMRYGVATARRAWLATDDVANTRAWAELDAMRKRGNARALAPARSLACKPGVRTSLSAARTATCGST